MENNIKQMDINKEWVSIEIHKLFEYSNIKKQKKPLILKTDTLLVVNGSFTDIKKRKKPLTLDDLLHEIR